QGRSAGPTNPFIPFLKEEIEQSIPARFEQQVAKEPERLAVKARTQALTYTELNRAANRVARAILEQRGHRPEPIAFFLDQGAAPIIAILGVLKAGKFYVPLDPQYPPDRVAYMLRDSEATLILTQCKHLPLARELARGAIGLLDMDELDPAFSPENPKVSPAAASLAYIMYTSGSTGQPKGVVGTHRTVLHDIRRITNALHISMQDRQTLIRSHSFSGTVRDIFGSLLNGASLHPLNLAEEGIEKLAGWLNEEKITTYRSVVSVFRSFVSTLRGGEQFPSLRLVYVGGEPAHNRDVELFQWHFSDSCLFVNGMSITEAGTVRHYFVAKQSPLPDDSVPVGYPVEDVEVLLLDPQGRDVGFHQIGEIAVKSRYLSPGYWKKPDLTRAKFLPGPGGGDERIYLTGDLGRMLPDGCLIHLGRLDFQVKVRGQRVEVGEIETALLALEGIGEAVVVARDERPDEPALVAYLVPSERPAPTVTALRRQLAAKLPAYMVPSAFVLLEAMPLAPNGKLDRRALPAPDRSRPLLENLYMAPHTSIEERLTAIWREVLGLEQIGVLDDFFDLGGHSLLATQIVSRVRDAFQVEVPLRVLLEAPTVARMAEVIAQSQLESVEEQRDMAETLGSDTGLQPVPELTSLPDAGARERRSDQEA
ncbi:MAG: non-ribosomal peptide synthetase, partial [Nitrospinae bacterium]|nr:non-ribosomal peptide synthetase [Nitrospinota bacterium]